MFDVAAERGTSNMSVAHVVERAGVSRRTFYELFDDCEDCLQAAFEDAVSYASERVLPAYEAQKGWRERIRAALIALLCFLDEEPTLGRLLIGESFGGGAATLARRNLVIAKLTNAIDEGRAQGKASFSLPSLTGEGIVGGVLSLIHTRLTERADAKPLVELANPLMCMIVLPYLGSTAARGELKRPVPPSTATRRPKDSTPFSDPFKDAGMRLTYRTVRVLMAIAEHPGASNRVVAETAEINDQGQISKLLTRVQRVGMVSNTGLDAGQGAPNSWTLTASGERVIATIRAHTEGRRPESHER
jgi:AcrR family transcriptional regulator